MNKQPQSLSAGSLPGLPRKGPSFRKEGLHQSGGWVVASKGPGMSNTSTRTSWQVPPTGPEAPTEAMIKGWPRWAIPGFLEQIPPRLEGCRQRLLAAEIELRRAEKAGGLEVGNASAPQEEDKTPAVQQDLPVIKAPEESHDEFADMPQEAVWILDQVGELETQFAELDTKMQELEVSHGTARKLRNQYVEDAGTSFAAMMELSSRVAALTAELNASRGTAAALKAKLLRAMSNTQRLQQELAAGHNVATHLSQKLTSARTLAERYKGDWEAVAEEHSQLRAQHESLQNAKFVLEKDVAAHQGKLAKAGESESQLRSELQRAEERLEQLSAESASKDAALRELQGALATEQEATRQQALRAQQAQQEQAQQAMLAPLPQPLAAPPPDSREVRAEAAAVARLVVKDWIRSATPEPAPVDSAGAAEAAAAADAEVAELRKQLQKMQSARAAEAEALRSRLQEEEAKRKELADELELAKGKLDQVSNEGGAKSAALKKLSEEKQEAEAALQKLEEQVREKDQSCQKLSSESQEKDATIAELEAAVELQKERARAQADASDDDLRAEITRVQDQLDQLTAANREKDAALRQFQESAEVEKAEFKTQADAAEEQLRRELKEAHEKAEGTSRESQEKDATLKQLSESLEALQAKAQEATKQAAAKQEELQNQISSISGELEQLWSQNREKDAEIQRLQAALDSEKADVDREEIQRMSTKLEAAERVKKENEALVQRLRAELDAQKEAAQSAKPPEALPTDPAAEPSEAARAVARMAVKDWLRSAQAAASPVSEPAAPPKPEAKELQMPVAAEANSRIQQEQWLLEWPCGPKDLQMALVPSTVLCAGADGALAEGQVAPTRLWLDTTTDELYLQPLLPSGPPSKLKSSSVTSVICTQPSAYDADASLNVEIEGSGAVRSLKFFSDGEGIEMLLAALTRDSRAMPGQLMDFGDF